MKAEQRASWQRRLADGLHRHLWWLAAAAVLLLAIWMVLARQLLAMLPAWRTDLEMLVEQRIQTPLEIASLSGHMNGLSPVFVLEEVRLPGADPERPGLTIARIELTVDVMASLVQRTLLARSLLIRGLDIHALEDEHGRFGLLGIETLGAASESPAPPVEQLLNLLYRQKQVQVEQVSGSFTKHGLPPLAIRDLTLSMKSSGARHRLALAMVTADERIALEVRLDQRGDAYRRDQINGQGYVRIDLANADPALLPHWPLEVQPRALTGKVEGWLRIDRGVLADAALRARISDLSLSGGPFAEPWLLQQVNADARLARHGQGYKLELGRLVLDDAEARWRPGAMTMIWNEAGEHDWQVALHDVDVAPFAGLVQRIPWQQEGRWQLINAQLDALQPSGLLRRLSLRGVEREVSTLSARFQDITLRADAGRPGVSGLSGWISGDSKLGYGQINSPALQLHIPAQFPHPLSGAAEGVFRWRHDGERLRVDTGWVSVINDDARGQALISLDWRRDQVPELTLMAALTDGKAEHAARYIPHNKVGPAAANWLDQAFVSGTVDLGQFLHEGPVAIDPARQQDRTLQMQYLSDDLTLRFLPNWPLVSHLKADVLIDGRHISGRHLSGQLMGATLSKASVDIPSRQDHETLRLIVSGQLRGPATSIATLLHDTPLRDHMPEEVAGWQVEGGRFNGHLLLHWPLGEGGPAPAVRALGEIDAATLRSAERRLEVAAFGGAFGLDLYEGMSMPSLHATVLGQPVSGTIQTDAGRTRISWQGDAEVRALRDWLELDLLDHAAGNFHYDAELSLPWRTSGVVRLGVDSTLEGVEIALPSPFAKAAPLRAPFRLELTGRDNGADLLLRYQRLLSARLALDNGRLRAGRLRFGAGTALPPAGAGLTLEGTLSSVPLAPWISLLTESSGNDTDSRVDDAWPRLDLIFTSADLYGFPLRQVGVKAEPTATGWSLRVDGEQLAGTLDFPAGYRARGAQPLVVSAERITLAASPNQQGETLSPRSVPVMDVRVDALNLNGEDMGRWQFAARPLANGVVIEELDAQWRQTGIRGRVEWTEQRNRQSSHFVGSLDSKNLARSLRRWGLDPFAESDDARAVVDVRWPGAPTEFDYKNLDGQASVAIGPGRFPKTDSRTSALRVLGVFNVATVSRRLRLDFTDLYKKGMAFEEISGDFQIRKAKVATSNLRIRAPSAELRLRGEMDIEDETLDHFMEVTLPLSSNLYVGCLAGPAACAGIFVVERLWGNQLEKMTSLGYRVTGSWDEPKVQEAPMESETRSEP